MKLYDVIGLGNALVDILLDVSEAEFAPLGFRRSSMELVSPEQQKELLSRFDAKSPVLISGGSVANSMIAIAQLGGKGAYMCSIGDDKYGLFYASECESLKIALPNAPKVGGVTGTCVALITPDSERTMRTCLSISAELSERHVSKEAIAAAHWLFIEGYVFANQELGQGAIRKAIKAAKEVGTKVALTCSEAWVINLCNAEMHDAISQADLVFANETEAKALTGASSVEEAFRALAMKVPNVVVTAGSHGAWVKWDSKTLHVDSFPCTPRDLTGAGDMFAGTFLYGVTHGFAPDVAARCACFLAQKVIVQIGARLSSGTREFWDACVSGQV